MKDKMRLTLSYAPLLLGIWGTVAFAADDTTATRSTLHTSTAASQPAAADAPPAGSEPHKPPQAAFDACKSSSEGDACSVSFDGHTMSGTCRKGPNGEAELACVPAHRPGPPPEAVEACKGSAEGASCSMTMRDGQSLSGTCRKGPADSDVMACAPPQPQGPPPSTSNASRNAASNTTLTSAALERELDQLEKDIAAP